MDECKLYLVGGCVRDELLGLKPNDMDYLVITNSLLSLKSYLIDNNFEIFTEKSEFRTIRAKCNNTKVVADYTVCDNNSCYDTKHTIYENLSYRDFTINAIVKIEHSDGEIEYYDPFGGMDDIKRRLIRCVLSTRDRLLEDPIRGLRALRFSITKNFEIDQNIITMISSNEFIDQFKIVTKERIQNELIKMFKYDTLASIKLLSNLKRELLESIFGDKLWLLPTCKHR